MSHPSAPGHWSQPECCKCIMCDAVSRSQKSPKPTQPRRAITPDPNHSVPEPQTQANNNKKKCNAKQNSLCRFPNSPLPMALRVVSQVKQTIMEKKEKKQNRLCPKPPNNNNPSVPSIESHPTQKKTHKKQEL